MLSSRGRDLAIWITIFSILTLTTLALRFLALMRQQRKMRADDWLVILATISMLTLEGCTIWALHNGLGAHTLSLSSTQLTVQFKLQFSANVTWTMATVCCKLAILQFYLIIFPVKGFRIACYLVMIGSALYGLILVPIFFVACKPLYASWTPELHETHCWPWKYHSISAMSFNILLDVLIVALPLPVVWRIRMPLRKKIGVSTMFSLGLSIVAIMIWRLIFTVMPRTADYSYDLAMVALQSHLELWLGLIATNIPTIAPLLKNWIPSSMRKYFSSEGSKPIKCDGPVVLRTFGSGPNPRFKDFSRLNDVDIDERENQTVHGITVQQDFEISTASSGSQSATGF